MALGLGAAAPGLTLRALAAGLCVGAVLCFSNTYFGLQTGWVTMGSLQSAILGYGLFQGLAAAHITSSRLSIAELVIVQTTSVATATMPLAAGLVGIVPALGLLTEDERPGGPISFTSLQLLGWCAAMAFFGVFVAVPLRYQTIIREQLRFPSGTATAAVIKTLHGGDQAGPDAGTAAGCSSSSSSKLDQDRADQDEADLEVAVAAAPEQEGSALLHSMAPNSSGGSHSAVRHAAQRQQQWAGALRLLLWCFAAAGAYSLAAAWVKALREMPVFGRAAMAWGWFLQPSFGYIGQGMIMGPKTACSMMAGAITGWAVLGPAAKARGWAPGPIKSIETGAAGWLMWVGLAILLGDCFTELALLIGQTAWQKVKQRRPQQGRQRRDAAAAWTSTSYRRLIADAEQGPGAVAGSALELSPSSSSGALDGSSTAAAAAVPSSGWAGVTTDGPGSSAASEAEDASLQDSGSKQDSGSWLMTAKFWVPGLLLSTLASTSILSPLMGMPVHEPLVAVLVALLVALLAVRALGSTDLNPVSGVGKVSQLVFAVVSPGAVVPNLVAGAIAEAGAQQAGDLMQDFKTAHLLGVSPSSQLVAMLLGSAASVPLSVAAYLLYTTAWQVPGPVLQAPMAQIWLDMAKLVNGGKLPDRVGPFCLGAAIIAALLPLVQHLLLHMKAHQQPGGAEAEAAGDPLGSSFSQHGLGSSARKTSSSGSDEPALWDSSRPAFLARLTASLRLAVLRLQRSCGEYTAVDWALTVLPSGVGFAVGMYLSPNWTLPRLLGSLGEQLWLLLSPGSHIAYMMVTASGLVLGEGCASVVTAVIQAALA